MAVTSKRMLPRPLDITVVVIVWNSVPGAEPGAGAVGPG